MSSNRIKVLENELKTNHNNFMNICKKLREGKISSEDAVSAL